MSWIIYVITNNVNNKKYVGQTKQPFARRWYKHRWIAAKGSPLPFHNSIRKYGKDNFSHEIVENNLSTQELADEKERLWISSLNSNNKKFGYNLNSGGQKFASGKSLATLEKMRLISTQRMSSPKMREHMSRKTTEFFSVEENRKKASEIATQNIIDNPSIIVKISEGTSKAIKNKWNDPEYRAKQIAARKRKWADPEYKKMMLAARKVKKVKKV